MAEVVVAFGILAFVALTIAGLFLSLLQTSAKSREQAMAELLTESLLERATAAGPVDASGHNDWGVAGQTKVRLEAQLEQDGTKFFYQVDPEAIGGSTSADGRAYKVTVTVGWWPKESAGLDSSREGFGNLFVKGTRTVYIRHGDRV